MCTVTCWPRHGGYLLGVNRDERRSRAPVTGLAAVDGGGIRRAWPIDGQAGGTWVGAGSQGLALALLNHYPPGRIPVDGAPSRGRLIPYVLDAAGVGTALDRLDPGFLAGTNPFRLFAVDAAGARGVLTWDGERLEREVPRPGAVFLTSSGWQGAEVAAWRRGLFDRLATREAPENAAVRRLHFHTEPDRPAFGISMARPEARTCSYTEVEVTADRVVLRHLDRPPVGEWPEGELAAWEVGR